MAGLEGFTPLTIDLDGDNAWTDLGPDDFTGGRVAAYDQDSEDVFREVYGDFAGQEECEAKRGVDVGGASRFFYVAKATQAERNEGLTIPSLLTQDAPEKNDHPTVKPIALLRWLVRLATPAGGTVLDPFLGSGTTAIAAGLEGFPWIGIEREPDYMRIAEARISYWTTQPVEAIA